MCELIAWISKHIFHGRNQSSRIIKISSLNALHFACYSQQILHGRWVNCTSLCPSLQYNAILSFFASQVVRQKWWPFAEIKTLFGSRRLKCMHGCVCVYVFVFNSPFDCFADDLYARFLYTIPFQVVHAHQVWSFSQAFFPVATLFTIKMDYVKFFSFFPSLSTHLQMAYNSEECHLAEVIFKW